MNDFTLLVQAESAGKPVFWPQLLSRLPFFTGAKLEILSVPAQPVIRGKLICIPQKVSLRKPVSKRQYFSGPSTSLLEKRRSRFKTRVLGVGESDYEGLEDTLQTDRVITFTRGYAYRASVLRNLIQQISQDKKVPLSRLKVAITGMEGSLGRLCAQVLATQCQYLTLIGSSETHFQHLASRILYDTGVTVRNGREAATAFQEAEVLVLADQQPGKWGGRELDLLASGTWVIGVNSRIFKTKFLRRSDIYWVPSLMVESPGIIQGRICPFFKVLISISSEIWSPWLRQLSRDLDQPAPRLILPASMVETIILAMDNRLVLPASGEDVTIKQVEQIERVGIQAGFKPRLYHLAGK